MNVKESWFQTLEYAIKECISEINSKPTSSFRPCHAQSESWRGCVGTINLFGRTMPWNMPWIDQDQSQWGWENWQSNLDVNYMYLDWPRSMHWDHAVESSRLPLKFLGCSWGKWVSASAITCIHSTTYFGRLGTFMKHATCRFQPAYRHSFERVINSGCSIVEGNGLGGTYHLMQSPDCAWSFKSDRIHPSLDV